MLRALFLADTHLGIDWPLRPRIERRRRGDEFYANYLAALKHAVDHKVDFILHGGDLFYRRKVPDALVLKVFAPLLGVAEEGIDIYIVPGNHERSRIPSSVLASHPKIHIFDQPRSFVVEKEGCAVELSGFPFHGRGIRESFSLVLAQLRTTWTRENPDLRLLCIHEIVEGARVANYQFRSGSDTIRCVDLRGEYKAVLSGHIHRYQVLTTDLAGRPLSTPVFYPGSIERTSFGEQDEEKGFLELELGPGVLVRRLPLPSRPMATIVVDPKEIARAPNPSRFLSTLIARLDPNSMVRLRTLGPLPESLYPFLSAQALRALAPTTMNISLSLPRE